jgi:hypothetical protein
LGSIFGPKNGVSHSENFVAARKCFASRFATQKLEHESQHNPFSLCVPRPLVTVQETNWDAQREKSDGWPLFWAQIWTPKRGPSKPERRNENVIKFWTLFWTQRGPAIGKFCCCPQMFLQADLRRTSA